MLQAVLPIPPSANHLYGRYRDRVVLAEAARAYREMVAVALAPHRGALPAGARIHLSLRLYFPDRRRRDLDNALKALLDALASALEFDDSQIDELHVFRALDREQPRAEVRLLWDALPWHCAWCEPPPVPEATSGVCGFHSARLREQVRRHG